MLFRMAVMHFMLCRRPAGHLIKWFVNHSWQYSCHKRIHGVVILGTIDQQNIRMIWASINIWRYIENVCLLDITDVWLVSRDLIVLHFIFCVNLCINHWTIFINISFATNYYSFKMNTGFKKSEVMKKTIWLVLCMHSAAVLC